MKIRRFRGILVGCCLDLWRDNRALTLTRYRDRTIQDRIDLSDIRVNLRARFVDGSRYRLVSVRHLYVR